MQPDNEHIEEKLVLYLDNKRVELPELQSLVFLNIDSWGAGCKLCELSNSDGETRIVNSISDGMMEVFGIVSSFHIAQLQCNISKPVRIGQAKQIRVCNIGRPYPYRGYIVIPLFNLQLQVNATVPMQADGEPWMQAPADIRLQSRSQARVLKAGPLSIASSTQ